MHFPSFQGVGTGVLHLTAVLAVPYLLTLHIHHYVYSGSKQMANAN